MIAVMNECLYSLFETEFPSGWYKVNYGIMEFKSIINLKIEVYMHNRLHGKAEIINHIFHYHQINTKSSYFIGDGFLNEPLGTISIYWNKMPSPDTYLLVNYTAIYEEKLSSPSPQWQKEGF